MFGENPTTTEVYSPQGIQETQVIGSHAEEDGGDEAGPRFQAMALRAKSRIAFGSCVPSLKATATMCLHGGR